MATEAARTPAHAAAAAVGGYAWWYVLEDTPFYARFAVNIARTDAAAAAPRFHGVGEYLDLARFRRRSLQHLLRYKTRLVGHEPAP